MESRKAALDQGFDMADGLRQQLTTLSDMLAADLKVIVDGQPPHVTTAIVDEVLDAMQGINLVGIVERFMPVTEPVAEVKTTTKRAPSGNGRRRGRKPGSKPKDATT